ncbi:LPS O-antigen length regulator, partial [Colwellia sp. BRX8-8]|nr:LPS O-antigen length regulator [Colwellia sp. BRX8-8]
MENLQVPNQNQSSNNSTQQSTTQFSPEVLLLSQQLAEKNDSDDEIDLAELWRAIWSGKYIIIVISFIFAVSSIAFALSKPDVYKASILLAPASSDSAGGMGALAGQFGGLASLAGISLGGGGTDKTALALEIIKSRAFLETFIIKHELLVPLMASENWNRATDSLVINKEIYDSKNKKWLREASYPKKSEPSSWEAY